jgi:hypothetical protein
MGSKGAACQEELGHVGSRGERLLAARGQRRGERPKEEGGPECAHGSAGDVAESGRAAA